MYVHALIVLVTQTHAPLLAIWNFILPEPDTRILKLNMKGRTFPSPLLITREAIAVALPEKAESVYVHNVADQL